MKIWKEKDKHTNRFVHCADFTCAGTRHKPQAATRDELLDIIEAIRKRARAEKYGLDVEPEIVTLGELRDERLRDFNRKLKGDRKIIAILERFTDHLGEERDVRTVRSSDVRTFITSLRIKNKDLKSSSVNAYLNHINAMLRKAGEYFPALESWKSPRMPFEEESKPLDRIITEEELARLFFELRAPAGRVGKRRLRRERAAEVRSRHMVADLLELSLLTGMRKTETRTLRKTMIDWRMRAVGEVKIHGFIQLPPESTKTKEPRRVPLNREARELLERRANESTCPWLFPNTCETGPISDTVVGRLLRRIGERTGLPYGRRVEEGFTYHTSRHTAATLMLEAGATLKTVGRILGHTDETMTMRYGHTNFKQMGEAVASLNVRLKKGSNGPQVEKIPMDENQVPDK